MLQFLQETNFRRSNIRYFLQIFNKVELFLDPNYTFVDGKLKFTRPKGLKRGSSSTCTVEENPKIERLRRKRLAEGHANLNKKRKKPKRRKGRKGDTVYADDVDSADYDSDDVGKNRVLRLF